jgi:hypothetical protein
MNNLQATLLFPVRDAESRKQFLIASVIMLASMIVPLLPAWIVMGYGAKIMRQIIDEGREPSMPDWQGSDWGALLMEGLRLWGVRMLYSLPLMILMGCGFMVMFAGTGVLASASEGGDVPPALGGLAFMIGFGVIMLLGLLALPLGIVLGAVESHVVTKNSFQAAFQFKEWAPIFRKSFVQFLLAYLMIMGVSFILTFAMQIAMMTIVLLCVLPFLMMGISIYLVMVMSALFAQAYAAGRAALNAEAHASA